MSEALFDEMKAAIGFGPEDAENVRSLAPLLKPEIPAVVQSFYERLFRHERAREVFEKRGRDMKHQYALLASWLDELLTGPYADAYCERRRRIGATHVGVGLPQHYMFTGMALIREELGQRIQHAGIAQNEEKLESLHKLLMLDLAIMLESYKETYSEQARKFERSAVEEKLTRAEHLAEIGQLAASLAHEIKNPLAGISGAIQIIRDGMLPGDPHQPVVGEILGQIKRLDATVKDLLQYARPTPPQAKRTVLSEVLARVLSLLREEPALQRIRVKCDKGTSEITVHADDSQLEQLLINLIINAAHASNDGGTIHLGFTPNADRIRIVIRDEGRGMTPEVRERAFEPFYTTKAKGTGLGLSICRRIVEAHGGDIELESAVGGGTSVIVNLPRGRKVEERQATS